MSCPPQLFGIIGFPIAHSLSPAMHNAVFRHLALDSIYLAFEVPPHRLEHALHGIRGLGIRGINVTVPHKEAVVPFLDRISPQACFIGAVNTIVCKDEELIGYNTDGVGFSKALAGQIDFSLSAKTVLVLGSGGASRAVAAQAATDGVAQLILVNRTLARAQRLEHDLLEKFPGLKSLSLPLHEKTLAPVFPTVDLLVNATTQGLNPGETLPLPLSELPEHAVVFDLIYNPPSTALLREASRLGYRFLNGLWMLIYQGVASFEVWTGITPPIRVMEQALRSALGHSEAEG